MTATPEQGLNIKAAAWTICIHVILLLLFFLLSYSIPGTTAPPQEMGMEVNLGTDENGSGTDQPMATGDPAPNETSVAYKSAAQQSSEAKDMMQTTDADAPAVNNPVKTNTVTANNTKVITKTRTKEQEATEKTNTRPQKPRYVYNGSTGPGGNGAQINHPGSNEGNTRGNGDRGVPNGTPGAANYTGSPGNGNGGISHTLSGRDISPKQFSAEFHDGGTVVIRVTVDRDGNIISKSVKSSPSSELSNIALQKISQAKFSKSPDAAPEQIGTVTIRFKAHS